jgi:hypothetical protein
MNHLQKLKMRSKFFVGSLCLFALTACWQNEKPKAEKKVVNDTFALATPKGWDKEHFSIPISFAPSIKYKGAEDIRFAPGWGNSTSNDYWAYVFLWSLEGAPTINEKIIEQNLTAYYNGLIASNVQRLKIPNRKIFPTKATIEKIATAANDSATFSGHILMLDYMTLDSMQLNCMVHLKACSSKTKTFLLHEISPKPLTDSVWQGLNQLNEAFCK